MRESTARTFRVLTAKDLDRIEPLRRLPEQVRRQMRAVATVLPFRVNPYVVQELIDWDRVPDDPIFQLTFPQPGMLLPEDLQRIDALLQAGAPPEVLRQEARRIQARLNPHPAGQMELNVPLDERGVPLRGLQHKYRETVLFFPTNGQTCHTYCTYCFRWPQFVGVEDLRFASKEPEQLRRYVAAHPEVTDVLLTGGDPLVMRTPVLRRYVEPLLSIEHLQSVRIGTKSPAYWPQRFVTDPDADELLRLFERVVAAGKQLALMAHYSHPRELEPPIAQQALRRIRATGAVVRTQAPLIRHVNDDAGTGAELWRRQVRLGAVPYYMFVERDTGARHYFEVPLARALRIFNDAYRQVSGLARTVRGPSMSATPGKVLVDGVVELNGRRYFALKFLQARDPSWVGRLFFAEYDERAAWLDQLRPAFGEAEFFFEPALREMQRRRAQRMRHRSTVVPPIAPQRASAGAELAAE